MSKSWMLQPHEGQRACITSLQTANSKEAMSKHCHHEAKRACTASFWPTNHENIALKTRHHDVWRVSPATALLTNQERAESESFDSWITWRASSLHPGREQPSLVMIMIIQASLWPGTNIQTSMWPWSHNTQCIKRRAAGSNAMTLIMSLTIATSKPHPCAWKHKDKSGDRLCKWEYVVRLTIKDAM